MHDDELDCVRYPPRGNDGFILERLKTLRDFKTQAEIRLSSLEATAGASLSVGAYEYTFSGDLHRNPPDFGTITGLTGSSDHWSGMVFVECTCETKLSWALIMPYNNNPLDRLVFQMMSGGETTSIESTDPSFAYSLSSDGTHLQATPGLLTSVSLLGNYPTFTFRLFTFGDLKLTKIGGA